VWGGLSSWKQKSGRERRGGAVREAYAIFLGISLVGIIFSLLVKALLLLWGARLMKIPSPRFGKALMVSGLATGLAYGNSLLLGLSPGSFKVFAVGLLLAAWLGAFLFKCSFTQALGAATLAWGLGRLLSLVVGRFGLALLAL
jgi:hypothetical protein